MPDGMLTLGDLASQIRSKNAGPFWITLDIFFKDEADYRFVTTSAALSQQTIARFYQVDPATLVFRTFVAWARVRAEGRKRPVLGPFEVNRDVVTVVTLGKPTRAGAVWPDAICEALTRRAAVTTSRYPALTSIVQRS